MTNILKNKRETEELVWFDVKNIYPIISGKGHGQEIQVAWEAGESKEMDYSP